MSKPYHRTLFLKGSAGKLEAMLWTPAHPGPQLAAVVCHPHPLYGGTMHNKVVFQVAKTLRRLGAAVLRFNFRGAGLSEGKHDQGFGETEDVQAAVDFLAGQFPFRPLLLAGFSFGAWVGLRVGCAEPRVSELVGLGVPVDINDFTYLQECTKPKLFIQGSKDQFGSREGLEAVVAALPEPKKLIIIQGADHFFVGKLNQIDAVLREWVRERHAAL